MGLVALTILYPREERSLDVDAHAFPGPCGGIFIEVSHAKVPAGYAPLANIGPFRLQPVDVAVGLVILGLREPWTRSGTPDADP